MILPDYHRGSIVNVMRSIVDASGGASPAGPYAPHPLVPPALLAERRKLALLVVDGLGYDYLLDACADGALAEHLLGRVTSVFPSTTASAITTFLTGHAPKQHALTGWYMWFREIGAVAAPLPFTTRAGGMPLAGAGVDARRLFESRPIADRIDRRAVIVQRRDLVDSHYTEAYRGRAEVRGYRTLDGFFDVVRESLAGDEPCYVYAYWPQLDALCHHHGALDRRPRAHLREIDARFAGFLDALAGADATVVLTADHGFVDTSEDSRLELDDHPRLADTLVLPLCGEGRAVFCYVDPAKRALFEAYAAGELGTYCTVVAARELIDGEYLGLGEPHPRLAERIGHYALLMKDNYVLRDRLLGERARPLHVGVHGGTSAAEMYVPLVLAQP